MTTALAIACGVLAVLAGVLLVLLVGPRIRRARRAAPPEPAGTPAVDQLTHDLHEALAQYRAEAEAREVPGAAQISRPLRPALAPGRVRPVSNQPVQPARRPPQHARTPREPAPPVRPAHVAPAAPAPSPLRENDQLQDLLRQALTTAQAIPGADAAAVALPAWHEPLLGTVGLARHEADRLASTLPAARARTRSIVIDYEYEGTAGAAPGRLRHGVAVPIAGLPTPGLIMILTRSPEVELGASQVELLEEIVERMAPALAKVLEWDAAATPVSVTVRERADGGPAAVRSVQGQEGQEVRELHRFHDR